MILSNDTTPGKSKRNQGTTEGEKYLDNPKTAPGDDHMHNNAITFWDKLFEAWDWD